MKRFMYFESTEGGMDRYEITKEDLRTGLLPIPYWMAPACKAQDCALLDWMQNAEIGEMHEHRLGVAVRLKDAP